MHPALPRFVVQPKRLRSGLLPTASDRPPHALTQRGGRLMTQPQTNVAFCDHARLACAW